MLKTKIISSMEKVFVDQKVEDFLALSYISALKGERLSLQLICSDDNDSPDRARVAVRSGIHMLLTPVFTLALDTAIGGERLTT